MGKDKATLQFRGRPLWQIQFELLRKLHPSEIFISARTDPTWRPEDVRFVADFPPSRGPLSGLAASLAQMHTTHLLALAIDMPFMTEDFLLSLCDHIEPGCGVVPKIDNRAEPLAAIYPIIYLDGFHLKLRRQGRVENVAVYIVLGVDLDGHRDVLGHWLGDGTEGANF